MNQQGEGTVKVRLRPSCARFPVVICAKSFEARSFGPLAGDMSRRRTKKQLRAFSNSSASLFTSHRRPISLIVTALCRSIFPIQDG